MAWNSGRVERAYRYLDQVYQKKRNHLDIGNLKELFFIAVLKLQPKDSFSYEKEIETFSGQKYNTDVVCCCVG